MHTTTQVGVGKLSPQTHQRPIDATFVLHTCTMQHTGRAMLQQQRITLCATTGCAKQHTVDPAMPYEGLMSCTASPAWRLQPVATGQPAADQPPAVMTASLPMPW
jgi:hypothetical protein